MIDQVTNPTLVDVQFGEVAEILEQLRIEEEQGGLIEEVEVHHGEEIDQFDDCEEEEDGSEIVATDIVSDPVHSERENEVEENQYTLMTSNADKGDIQGKSAALMLFSFFLKPASLGFSPFSYSSFQLDNAQL